MTVAVTMTVPDAHNPKRSHAPIMFTTDLVLKLDLFVNLPDPATEWQKSPTGEHFFGGKDRRNGEVKWTGFRVDLAL